MKKNRSTQEEVAKLKERILQLVTSHGTDNNLIAEILNSEGFIQPNGRPFDRLAVGQRRWYYKKHPGEPKPPGRPKKESYLNRPKHLYVKYKSKKVTIPKECPKVIEVILGDSTLTGRTKWKFVRAILLNG